MPKLGEMFPSKYLSASDLPDEGLVLTIKSTEIEEVGLDKDSKPVLYFKEKNQTDGKGLVLNKTNANAISEALGSEDTDDWDGQRISIYPTETSFQGKTVPCIRVRLRLPKGKGKAAAAEPEPEAKSDEWNEDDPQF